MLSAACGTWPTEEREFQGQMDAQGNIYFTEGEVPLIDRERLAAAEREDPEGIAARVAEMAAEVERMTAERER